MGLADDLLGDDAESVDVEEYTSPPVRDPRPPTKRDPSSPLGGEAHPFEVRGAKGRFVARGAPAPAAQPRQDPPVRQSPPPFPGRLQGRGVQLEDVNLDEVDFWASEDPGEPLGYQLVWLQELEGNEFLTLLDRTASDEECYQRCLAAWAYLKRRNSQMPTLKQMVRFWRGQAQEQHREEQRTQADRQGAAAATSLRGSQRSAAASVRVQAPLEEPAPPTREPGPVDPKEAFDRWQEADFEKYLRDRRVNRANPFAMKAARENWLTGISFVFFCLSVGYTFEEAQANPELLVALREELEEAREQLLERGFSVL